MNTTSVMEGTSPGLSSPKSNPTDQPKPMAKTVGHPTRRKAVGYRRAVLCDLFPTTVIIEVIVASDAATYVFCRRQRPTVARHAATPAIEAVERGHRCGATCIELSPVSSTASPACNVWEIPSAEISRLPPLRYPSTIRVGIGIGAVGAGAGSIRRR